MQLVTAHPHAYAAPKPKRANTKLQTSNEPVVPLCPSHKSLSKTLDLVNGPGSLSVLAIHFGSLISLLHVNERDLVGEQSCGVEIEASKSHVSGDLLDSDLRGSTYKA